MKIVKYLIAFCLTGVLSLSALEIDKTSKLCIVLPDHVKPEDGGNILKHTAYKIRKSLQNTVGADLWVLNESKLPKGRKGIFLGDTLAARQAGIDLSGLQKFDSIMQEKDGNLFLIGKDAPNFGKLPPKTSTWTYYHFRVPSLKAAVYFLEEFCDVRFLLPGDAGTEYGKKKKIVIPAGFKKVIQPEIISFHGYWGDQYYAYSQNFFGAGDVKYFSGGHTYYQAVPAKQYFAKHPEYFAMFNGIRSGNGNHLCISNPQVQDLIYQQMLRSLDSGADITTLAQTDAYRPCECEACKKYGNTTDPGEKLWILHRQLAERLQKERPGKKVLILSYQATVYPPVTFDSFPDNTIIQLTRYTEKHFQLWSKVKLKNPFFVYVYNWGAYHHPGNTPMRTPEYCAEQIRTFKKYGVNGYFQCGIGQLWGLNGPVFYIYGKLLNKPERNERELLDEFCKHTYGPAARPMKQFFTALYRRIALFDQLQKTDTAIEGITTGVPEDPKPVIAFLYPPAALKELENNLVQAEKLCKEKKYKDRLLLTRVEFDYVKNLAETVHYYYTYQLAPTDNNFTQLAESLKRREILFDQWFDAKGTKKKLKEWPSLQILGGASRLILQNNGWWRAAIGAPFNWNADQIAQIRKMPRKNMNIATVDTVKDANDPAWSKAEWQTLVPLNLSVNKAETRFKVVADTANLHILIETTLQDSKRFTPAGRDNGHCHGSDCIEIFVVPSQEIKDYLQIAFNPVANSFADYKGVFKGTQIHSDRSWNPDWKYTVQRKNNMWISHVTIPFAAIGKKPQKNTLWRFNLSRSSYPAKRSAFGEEPGAENKKTSDSRPELSSWAPSMESRFNDVDTFGELRFR
ncbi:MAG: DUF4838 domain-containing protein [Lentisphaeria bacterium]|nr:DUF4838 domain-containing protein [Lentisphaeria bacterium]